MAFTDRLHNRGSISTGYDIDQSATFDDTRNQWLENTMSYNSGRANNTYKKMNCQVKFSWHIRIFISYELCGLCLAYLWIFPGISANT